MRRNVSPARWFFTLLLLAGLFFGAAGQSLAREEAALRTQAATNVVISEFRTRGPDGGNDEFVELFNPTNALVDISGWQIRASTASGSSTTSNRYIMPGGTQIQSGQHYLIVGSTYSGTVPGEIGAQLSSGTADGGGLALTLSDGTTIIDQVGMSVATVYKEGTPLQSLTTDTNRSYERIMDATGSCIDANDNFLDYFIRSPSDPQNSASPINTCGDATPTPVPPTDTPTSTQTFTPSPTPTVAPPLTLVINEVAWSGTKYSSSDEWIELYNPNAFDINLNGWRLVTDDGKLDITLSGAISGTVDSERYFVIGRYANIFSDATVDLAFSASMGTWSSLNNSGTVLRLLDPGGALVDSANSASADGEWLAGSASPNYASMERIGPILVDGPAAWATFADTTFVTHDRASVPNPIWGTPGQANWTAGTVTVTPSPSNTPTKTSTPTNTSTGTPTLTFTPSLTPTRTSLKTVVITEVAWMGTAASSSDEWIELYNTTNARVYLNGWRLRSYRYNGTDFVLNLDIDLTDHYIDPRTSIEPKNTSGYFLLEAGNDNTVSDITSDNSPGEGMIYQGSLYNSGEILLLCSTLSHCNINTKNQVVDYVNGSLTTTGNIKPWPAGSSSTYGSMERKNLISDEETNYFTHTGANPKWGLDASGNAIKGTPKHDNWAYNVTSTPRPTATSTSTRTPLPNLQPVPLLVLNEILARAGTDWNNDGAVDIYDEFIEVINSGTVDVNLGGYKLDDYELDANGKLLWNGFTLPSQTLKPGEKAVFYGSQTGILLNDSGDTVYLMRVSNNSVVDSYKYPVVKSVDVSICRYVDAYGSWLERCFPTPGQPNSLTGEQTPSTSGGPPAFVCLLPDSIPEEFILAECEESGLGIWNRSYWDSLPGEGDEIWLPEESGKWPVIYQ